MLANYKGEPKDLDKRVDAAVRELSALFDKNPPEVIVAEEALQKFTGGKTTAKTMNKLIAMNFCLTYTLSRRWTSPAKYLSVNVARKACGIKIPKQPKGKKKDASWTKRHVISAVAKKYPMLTFDKTAKGNYKKGFDDMADAIVIGEAYHLLNDT